MNRVAAGCPGTSPVVLALAVLGFVCVLLLAMYLYAWAGELIQDRVRGTK